MNKKLMAIIAIMLGIVMMFPTQYVKGDAPGDGSADASVFDEEDPIAYFGDELFLGNHDYELGKPYEFRVIVLANDYAGKSVKRNISVKGPDVKLLQVDQYTQREPEYYYNNKHKWIAVSNYNGTVSLKDDKRYAQIAFGKTGIYTIELTVKSKDGTLLDGRKRYIKVSEGQLEVIIPPIEPEKLSCKKDSTGKNYKLKWSASDNASKYGVYANGKLVKTLGAKTTSYTISKASLTKENSIIGVTAIDENGLESLMNTIAVVGETATPAKVSKLKVKSYKGKKIKASWKKVSNATGYWIQYSRNKKFKKGNKTVKIKKQSVVKTTIKNLKAKKKYYVRIRAYRTANGSTKYSPWTYAKVVKTKK